MSHVKAAVRWMHPRHFHLNPTSLSLLRGVPFHHRIICSTFERAFSGQCSLRLDVDAFITNATAGQVTQFEAIEDTQPSATRALGLQDHESQSSTIPSNLRKRQGEVQSSVNNNNLESVDTVIASKGHEEIWRIFKIRPIDVPLNSAYVSGPLPGTRFRVDFALAFSRLLIQYREGKSLFMLQRLYAGKIKNADLTWHVLSDRLIGRWLDNHLGVSKRSGKLVDLLLGSLLKSADRMLDVLETLEELDNDFDVRASCLYVTVVLYKPQLLANDLLMQRFDKAVDKLRAYEKWPDDFLHPDIVNVLLWRSNNAQILGLINCLKLKYENLTKDTILLLASSCAARHLSEQTFALLHSLPDRALEDANRTTLKVCMMLLRHDTVVNTPNGPTFQYLTELLEKGLPPDDLLYGRVIENALASQYPGVAWDVYHHTRSLNTVLPPSTYVKLLRDAFDQQRIYDVKSILAEIHQKEALYKNRELALYCLNMIRRLCHGESNMSATDGLTHILALYDRVWTREPLAHFGIIPRFFETPGDLGQLRPDDYVITFTIWAFVLCHKNGKDLKSLWSNIQELVRQGDEMTMRCMNSDLIYNALIWLNMKHPENFRNAVEILRYMVSSELCLPTSRTWSVVICGFLYHKQDDKAQQMYELMLAHGFNIEQIGREYMPKGATMNDLRRRVNAVMHEQSLSQGIIELEDEVPESNSNEWTPAVSQADTTHIDTSPDLDLELDKNSYEPVAASSA